MFFITTVAVQISITCWEIHNTFRYDRSCLLFRVFNHRPTIWYNYIILSCDNRNDYCFNSCKSGIFFFIRNHFNTVHLLLDVKSRFTTSTDVWNHLRMALKVTEWKNLIYVPPRRYLSSFYDYVHNNSKSQFLTCWLIFQHLIGLIEFYNKLRNEWRIRLGIWFSLNSLLNEQKWYFSKRTFNTDLQTVAI